MNQGQIPLGEAVDEQLESMGIQPADLDYVLLTHLDCDHANGLRAVKITREDGKYVLLFSDGGYATKSWKEMITSGVSLDKEMQRKSLQWIREQSMDANCIESHDILKLFHFVLVGTATNDFYLKTLFQVVLNAQTQFRIIPCEDTAGDVSEAIISHNWNFFRCKVTNIHGKFVYLHQGLFR